MKKFDLGKFKEYVSRIAERERIRNLIKRIDGLISIQGQNMDLRKARSFLEERLLILTHTRTRISKQQEAMQ